jgi:hypothetical protein
MDEPQCSNTSLWDLDEYRCWNLRVERVHVWLQPRPPYCDRGHWLGNVHGIGTLDPADAFPRYYMDLERAKLEMAAWVHWRLECERRRGDAALEP